MQSEKITRTKLLKENQYYFFTLNQATNLPSEVKDLIDSYLYIIFLVFVFRSSCNLSDT